MLPSGPRMVPLAPLAVAVVLVNAVAIAPGGLPSPANGTSRTAPDALVDATTVIPSLRLDIRYATAQNFTGKVIYRKARCRLRLAVALRLRRGQEALAARGPGGKGFDCFPPPAAPRPLWRAVSPPPPRPLPPPRGLWRLLPDPRSAAAPRRGPRHSGGAAVDLTIVPAGGSELPIPTGFDEFSGRAHRRYRSLPDEVLHNRDLLEKTMVGAGF